MRTSPKDTTWRRKFEITAHMNAAPRARARCFEGDRCRPRPQLTFGELSTDGRAAVSHSVPFSLRDTTTMSPPNFLDRFHEPWRATKMALRYSDGNIVPL
jgi:hypothetical protein